MKVFSFFSRIFFILLLLLCCFRSIADSKDFDNSTIDQERTVNSNNPALQESDLDQIKNIFLSKIYTLDKTKPAVQALKELCPNSYSEIKSYIGFIDTIDEMADRKVMGRDENEDLMYIFEKQKEECADYLKIEYFDYYNNSIQKKGLLFIWIARAFTDHRNGKGYNLINSLESDKENFKELNALNVTRTEFYKECVLETFKSRHEDESKTFHSYKDWARVLQNLKSKNCKKRKESLKPFLLKLEERYRKAQDHCAIPLKPNSCVLKLRQKVGLDPDRNNVKSFFSDCTQSYHQASYCCSSNLEGCKSDFYKTFVDSVSGLSKQECFEQSKNFDSFNQNLDKNRIQLCQDSVQTCETRCTEDLNDFKKEFLTCFFLPNWTSQTKNSDFNYWKKIPNNTCESHIKEVREEYNKWVVEHSNGKILFSEQSSIKDLGMECQDHKRKSQRRDAVQSRDLNRKFFEKHCAKPDNKQDLEESSSFSKPSQKGNSQAFLPEGFGQGQKGNRIPSGRDSLARSPVLESDHRSTAPSLFVESSDEDGDESSYTGAEFQRKEDIKKEPEDSLPKFELTKRQLKNISKNLANRANMNYIIGQNKKRLAKEKEIKEKILKKYQKKLEKREFKAEADSFFSGGIKKIKQGVGGIGSFVTSSLGSAWNSLKEDSKKTKGLTKDYTLGTVKEAFNIHGSEVDLLQNQKRLIELFCQANPCGYEDMETGKVIGL